MDSQTETTRRVRDGVAGSWILVLQKLRSEVQSEETLSKSLVERLRIASDQIRRDFRLPHESPEVTPESPEVADPLQPLRIVFPEAG